MLLSLIAISFLVSRSKRAAFFSIPVTLLFIHANDLRDRTFSSVNPIPISHTVSNVAASPIFYFFVPIRALLTLVTKRYYSCNIWIDTLYLSLFCCSYSNLSKLTNVWTLYYAAVPTMNQMWPLFFGSVGEDQGYAGSPFMYLYHCYIYIARINKCIFVFFNVCCLAFALRAGIMVSACCPHIFCLIPLVLT